MATWTKATQHAATWTKGSKHSATWTKGTKSLGVNSFLLQETGFYVLQEDGVSKLILEQSNPSGPSWSKLTKS